MAVSSNLGYSTTSTTKLGSSAESRSTSAGSRESRKSQAALPEYEYPVPVVIRNTFLDTQDARSASLEAFFEERKIHSCPVVPPVQQPDTGLDFTESFPFSEVMFAGAQAFATHVATATGFWAATPTASEYDGAEHHSPVDVAHDAPQVLVLAEALAEPVLGSANCPTVGSTGHYDGTCKPCAFLYTKGCQNGVQCTFCHLCPPDEKRRRQKEKHQASREMRRQKKLVEL